MKKNVIDQITLNQSPYFTLFKEMAAEVIEKNNDKAIPLYYDKGFELRTNGKTLNYEEFLQSHIEFNNTSIQYKVRYDEETLVEQGNKIAIRLFQRFLNPNGVTAEIEVILIAEYKDKKIYRLWHLTYPDWSKMEEFLPSNMP